MIDIKLFVRNLIHNKLYFAITVLGFAIALTFVLVLSVYIRQELSVDQFHQNKDRIYRVVDEEGSYWGAVVANCKVNILRSNVIQDIIIRTIW